MRSGSRWAYRCSACITSRGICSRRCWPQPKPAFPFVALLVSGGHSQLYAVGGVGDYTLLGDTQDDAAGEAFDKTAKLLGLPYPGGPALSKLAESGRRGAFALPRPMKDSGDLNMSFSGLKTAVLTLARDTPPGAQRDADIAREFEDAITDVLVAKSLAALDATGLSRLVVAGGVGANRSLRERLSARRGSAGAAKSSIPTCSSAPTTAR